MYKITFKSEGNHGIINLLRYVEKHQRGNNKPNRNKDG